MPPRASQSPAITHIDHRGSVYCFEVAHQDPVPIHLEDGDCVETEGVGPVLGSGVEHASHGLALVVTGMNTEHRAVCEVEPGDDMDPLPNGQIPHRRLVSLVEDQPGFGPTLGALFRRLRGIGEGRFDVANRVQLVAHG